MLATFTLGEAFESADSRSYAARSRDSGRTWELEKRLPEGTDDPFASNYSRLTAFPGGLLKVFMVRHDRKQYPEEGLANPETLGFVPTDLLTLTSNDYGHSWNEPQPLEPAISGCPFEICAPITPLLDGRWVIPTSTWHNWDGDSPYGQKMLAFVSPDQGQSWPQVMDVMCDPEQQVMYWESKIIELSSGHLLAVAWAYDQMNSRDLPNVYALSEDGGRSWTEPASMELHGQTLTPLALKTGASSVCTAAWINPAYGPISRGWKASSGSMKVVCPCGVTMLLARPSPEKTRCKTSTSSALVRRASQN